jgi:hypothetical protein
MIGTKNAWIIIQFPKYSQSILVLFEGQESKALGLPLWEPRGRFILSHHPTFFGLK